MISAFIMIMLFFSSSRIVCAAQAVICDIQLGPCVQETSDGINVAFDIQPKPVTAMSELTFIILLTRNGNPLSDASVELDLSMPGMFMGRNHPVLKPTANGRYEGKGIITRCMSGRKTWQARVTIVNAATTHVADFEFAVK